MFAQIEKLKENKSRAAANSVIQEKGDREQRLGFVDNRPEVIKQKQLKKISKNNSLLQIFPVQMMPALVKGRTHLVKKRGNSLMRGEMQGLVHNNDLLDVNSKVRLRSRRGPSQERVGDYDVRGEHIYRWFLVNELKSGDV